MFKFVVVLALLATVATAQRHQGFNKPRTYTKQVSASSDDAHAEIISAGSDVRADGFDYHLETSNAIAAKANGDAAGNQHGDFQWISPEGEHIALSYVADENGYQPNSAILPTPPPIPEAILKALRYIEAHPPKEESNYHSSPVKSNKPAKHGRRF